jgi:hypothetical protein
MSCCVPGSGAFRQSGNWAGVYYCVPYILACCFSSGGLVSQASRSAYGHFHEFPQKVTAPAGFPKGVSTAIENSRKKARPSALSPKLGLCYNRKAVKNPWKQEPAPADVRGEAVVASAGKQVAAAEAAESSGEDASRFCPICSQRLESRRCKLVCNVCGYYMSCADYY